MGYHIIVIVVQSIGERCALDVVHLDQRFAADQTELCLSSVKLSSDLRGARSRLPSHSTFLWARFSRIYSSMGRREGAPCPSIAPGPRARVGSPWCGGAKLLGTGCGVEDRPVWTLCTLTCRSACMLLGYLSSTTA
jgi:hypothetical protein